MDRIDNFKGPFWFLSNFAFSPLMYGGLSCDTVEHAFQAAKATSEDLATMIVAAPTPQVAKTMGRKVALRSDWEQVKDMVMLDCLRAKFAGSAELAEQLDRTGDAWLEEGNTWGDRYWGTVNGEGANMLGRLLMVVRKERRRSAQLIEAARAAETVGAR